VTKKSNNSKWICRSCKCGFEGIWFLSRTTCFLVEFYSILHKIAGWLRTDKTESGNTSLSTLCIPIPLDFYMLLETVIKNFLWSENVIILQECRYGDVFEFHFLQILALLRIILSFDLRTLFEDHRISKTLLLPWT
jgi:hypothetical protein